MIPATISTTIVETVSAMTRRVSRSLRLSGGLKRWRWVHSWSVWICTSVPVYRGAPLQTYIDGAAAATRRRLPNLVPKAITTKYAT